MCSASRSPMMFFAMVAMLSSCARNAPAPTAAAAPPPTTQPKRILRIAADPNNLPFTNQRLEGFENKIARIIADDLGAQIEYTWRAQRRGFFREMLKENRADLVLGVPLGFDMALTTKPY